MIIINDHQWSTESDDFDSYFLSFLPNPRCSKGPPAGSYTNEQRRDCQIHLAACRRVVWGLGGWTQSYWLPHGGIDIRVSEDMVWESRTSRTKNYDIYNIYIYIYWIIGVPEYFWENLHSIHWLHWFWKAYRISCVDMPRNLKVHQQKRRFSSEILVNLKKSNMSIAVTNILGFWST